MATRRKTAWALVGLGLQGQRLARAIQISTSASLAAVVSEDIERAKKFADEFNVSSYYESLQKAFAKGKVDAVCIATPNNRHAREVVLALSAEKDVLCEKPLALTKAEGTRILRAQKKSSKRCFVDFQLRMHPAVLYAKKLISRNALGKLVHIEMQWSIGTFGEKTLAELPRHMQWREDPDQAGGGAIMARGVHLFDLVRFLSEKEVAEVRAYSDAMDERVDRTALGLLTLRDGTPVVVATSKNTPAAENRIILYGVDGKVSVDVFGKKSACTYTSSKGVFNKVFRKQDLYRAIFDAYRDPKQRHLLATAMDGVVTMKIVRAFKESAKKKRAVRIKYDR